MRVFLKFWIFKIEKNQSYPYHTWFCIDMYCIGWIGLQGQWSWIPRDPRGVNADTTEDERFSEHGPRAQNLRNMVPANKSITISFILFFKPKFHDIHTFPLFLFSL